MTEHVAAALHKLLELAGMKAQRDPDEPGIDSKHKMEENITKVIIRHWRKQKRAIKDQLSFWHAGRKADISAGLVHVEDDPEFLAMMINLLLKGAESGADLMADSVRIGFDPTLTNVEAAKWAKKYVGQLVKKIDADTEKALRRAVSDFIETPGMTIGDVMDRLPFNGYRAQRIAVTETTRAYAQGQLDAGRALKEEVGDVTVVKQWFTNQDDIVCEICGPLAGVEVEVGQAFQTAVGELDAPPAHPNCRCWLSHEFPKVKADNAND